MKREKVKHQLTETTVDKSTGEIIDLNKTKTIAVGKEPHYYKVYIEDLAKLHGLNPTENQVIQILASNMQFDNLVVLVKQIKLRLTKETGKELETIEKAIKGLTLKKILIKEERSVYRVNPKYIAKGSWEEIKKLRLIIEYSEQGKEIHVENINQHSITYREEYTKEPKLEIENINPYATYENTETNQSKLEILE